MTEPLPLPPPLLVAFGGGAGAWLRYETGRLVARLVPGAGAGFPWATLAVNLAGSFAMGVLVAWLARHGSSAAEGWRLLLGVGLLGGYTTFSSFSLELVTLAQRGAFTAAVCYAALSLAAGIAALAAGLAIARAAA